MNMNGHVTFAEAKEINDMLVSDINRFLNERYAAVKNIPVNPQKYHMPEEWLFLASSIKTRYRAVGWTVDLSVESISGGKREYYLSFKQPKEQKKRGR